MSKMRRIAIAGGGTAGHVAVGIAIAVEYRKAFQEVNLLFVGHFDRIQEGWITGAGFAAHQIPVTPFARQKLGRRAAALLTLPAGFVQSREVLRRSETRLLIAVGAYPAVAPTFAARALRLGIVVHEANVTPGLATSVGARFADAASLGWEETRALFRRIPTAFTGNPIRMEIEDGLNSGRKTAIGGPGRVLVTGGSEGSLFLNSHVPRVLGRLRDKGVAVEVWHQTGCGGCGLRRVEADYKGLGVLARVDEFIGDMSAAYAWANFAISAAGAITLAELAAFGLPCLLVPSSRVSGDHQLLNAQAFARRTKSPWITEAEWDEEKIACELKALLLDEAGLERRAISTAEFARPGASGEIVRLCERVMEERRW